MEKSRTEYSALNTVVAVISRMMIIVLAYVTRVVFTRMLSEDYVGVNGLFTDILNVLSLTELGVGTAITYALYAPIAKRDEKKQQQLMLLYRTFYRWIAAIVAMLGLILVPFLDVLMKHPPQVEHLTLIYLLYLTNSVLSYLLIYKRTLIEAHQKSYIVLLYQTGFTILQNVLQIVALIATRNFLLYLFISLACTLGTNLSISHCADRMYPYLRKPCEEKLPAQQRADIFRNIRAMMMHKFGAVIVNNTDNLLLSAFVGVASVGIYSNYYLVIGSVRQMINQAFVGITASVGNLGATEEKDQVRKIFEITFFIGQWLYGFAVICLYELLDPFVELSFGSQYLFGKTTVLILCINFYVNGMRSAALTFRDSMGLFWYDRYKALIEAILNLALSIALVQRFGASGVFIGTFFSMLLTAAWVEPYVLYRKGLHAPLAPFFGHYALYALVMGLTWWLTDRICAHVTGGLPLILGGRFLICLVVPNVLWLICYHRTKGWRGVCACIRMIWEKRRRMR